MNGCHTHTKKIMSTKICSYPFLSDAGSQIWIQCTPEWKAAFDNWCTVFHLQNFLLSSWLSYTSTVLTHVIPPPPPPKQSTPRHI